MTWSTLDIALVQEAATLDPAENRARLAPLTPAGADLVVFPEVFARDFGKAGSDVREYAEPLDGPFATEVDRVATERGTTIVAGMFERTDDLPFNTLVVRGGARASYRKIHLYDSFGYRESEALTGGALTPTVLDIGGVPTGLMTCYDLRFPELARALVDAGAELIVVPAAWVAGERKVDHWRTLLRARAIENTVYVAATGQPAPRYCGHSMVVDPLGDVVVEAGGGAETVTATITRERLTEARAVNPSLANRRL
jgi:deaminated glutathione amidase